eukprot:scaffold300_cov258-Pinguiococcus_pyrenoidosus.AAC.32
MHFPCAARSRVAGAQDRSLKSVAPQSAYSLNFSSTNFLLHGTFTIFGGFQPSFTLDPAFCTTGHTTLVQVDHPGVAWPVQDQLARPAGDCNLRAERCEARACTSRTPLVSPTRSAISKLGF